MSGMKVILVGAGIGGLAAANALLRGGHTPIVLEQATALGEVGAGVQLGPNATRVLQAMDLLEPLMTRAVTPEAAMIFSYKSGEALRKVAFADALKSTFGFPYLHMYRPDLLDGLAHGYEGDLHLGAKTISIIEEPGRVGARLENGETVWGDVLVGCDGIHSAVRKHLHGDTPANFSGNMAWRGLCPGDAARKIGVPVVSAAE